MRRGFRVSREISATGNSLVPLTEGDAPIVRGCQVGLNQPDVVGVQVLAQANTCNNVANSFTDFLATATPMTVGTTGQRSFGSDARGTIYQDSTGAILAWPLAVAGTVTILQ